MPFIFTKLEIPEVISIKPKVFNDSRGLFFESYKKSEFGKNGINDVFVQDNCSHSGENVVRGLHYQLPPHEQSKLVWCTRGKIFDVAVDLRRDSPTFSKWVAMELSAENKEMIYIPAGFAHGFMTLSIDAVVMYKVSKEYNPESERGIIWNDPQIAIDWPANDVLISDKDLKSVRLNKAEIFD